MSRRPPTILLALAAALCSCSDESYFGPYQLLVPTELMELAAGRTFAFPLNADDLDRAGALQRCLEEQAERPVPCICDYPVRSLNGQDVRVDYRLLHLEGEVATVMVWIGREVDSQDPPPNTIVDLPRVQVLGEHHHQLPRAGSVDASFLEEEMTAVELAWSGALHPDCAGQPQGRRPGPLALLLGISLESRRENHARVSLAFTIRVRENN